MLLWVYRELNVLRSKCLLSRLSSKNHVSLLCVSWIRGTEDDVAFGFDAARIWNELPENSRCVENDSSFKSGLI